MTQKENSRINESPQLGFDDLRLPGRGAYTKRQVGVFWGQGEGEECPWQAGLHVLWPWC